MMRRHFQPLKGEARIGFRFKQRRIDRRATRVAASQCTQSDHVSNHRHGHNGGCCSCGHRRSNSGPGDRCSRTVRQDYYLLPARAGLAAVAARIRPPLYGSFSAGFLNHFGSGTHASASNTSIRPFPSRSGMAAGHRYICMPLSGCPLPGQNRAIVLQE